MDIIKKLAEEFKLKEEQVARTVALIDDGNTIPFISRYRKEETGSLDDTVLRDLDDRLTYLRNIEKRKAEVKNLITEMGKMTDEIALAIDNAKTITEVDDIYRPFRPHRKTRASVAKEKGLEPLAELILAQNEKYEPSIEEAAEAYVSEEKQVTSAEEAINGACDIIAESISDNADFRKTIRKATFDTGFLNSKGATEEDSVYSQYYDYSERLCKIPSHRILAINSISTVVMLFISFIAVMQGENYIVDIALIYAVLGFISVVILCKAYLRSHKKEKANDLANLKEQLENVKGEDKNV